MSCLRRAPRGKRLIGDDDVAEMAWRAAGTWGGGRGGKGQHVGGGVLAAPLGVHGFDGGIVGKQHGDFGGAEAGRRSGRNGAADGVFGLGMIVPEG